MAAEARYLNLEQALSVQRAFREGRETQEGHFPVAAFIEKISDEIEQMRQAGHTDSEMAKLISETTGVQVGEGDIAVRLPPASDAWAPN